MTPLISFGDYRLGAHASQEWAHLSTTRRFKPDDRHRLFRRRPHFPPRRLDRRHRIEPDGAGHRQELDHVEPALEALDLGYVGLGLTETVGDRLLGQAGIHPRRDEAIDQGLIDLGMDGTGQGSRFVL